MLKVRNAVQTIPVTTDSRTVILDFDVLRIEPGFFFIYGVNGT
jgi:hypothetical protein